MNIQIGSEYNKIQYNNSSPSFGAKKIAEYKLFKNTGFCDIFQIEKKDYKFFQKETENLNNFYKKYNITDDETKLMTKISFNSVKALLKSEIEDKLQILMAFKDKKPCGIIIGNAKKNNNLYSCRKNQKHNETEFDLFVTWDINSKGIGKALFNECLILSKKSGFENIFLRSENPEKSPNAYVFYKAFGFTDLRKNKEYQKYLGNNFVNYKTINVDFWKEDLVIPMEGNYKQIDNFIKKISNIMERKEFTNSESFSLSEFINA